MNGVSRAEQLPSAVTIVCPMCGRPVTTSQSGNTTRCPKRSGGCGHAIPVPAGSTRPRVSVDCYACGHPWKTRAQEGATIRCPKCRHPRRVPTGARDDLAPGQPRPAAPARASSPTATRSTRRTAPPEPEPRRGLFSALADLLRPADGGPADGRRIDCYHCGHYWRTTAAPGNTIRCPQCRAPRRIPTGTGSRPAPARQQPREAAPRSATRPPAQRAATRSGTAVSGTLAALVPYQPCDFCAEAGTRTSTGTWPPAAALVEVWEGERFTGRHHLCASHFRQVHTAAPRNGWRVFTLERGTPQPAPAPATPRPAAPPQPEPTPWEQHQEQRRMEAAGALLRSLGGPLFAYYGTPAGQCEAMDTRELPAAQRCTAHATHAAVFAHTMYGQTHAYACRAHAAALAEHVARHEGFAAAVRALR